MPPIQIRAVLLVPSQNGIPAVLFPRYDIIRDSQTGLVGVILPFVGSAVKEIVEITLAEDARRFDGVAVSAVGRTNGHAESRGWFMEAPASLGKGMVDLEPSALPFPPEIEVEKRSVMHHLGAADEYDGGIENKALIPISGTSHKSGNGMLRAFIFLSDGLYSVGPPPPPF